MDVRVRGRLLANAAVAEVQCRYMCQEGKVRLAVEKLQTEREVSQLPQKVQMQLGVSFFPFFFIALRLKRVAGYRCASECSGGVVERHVGDVGGPPGMSKGGKEILKIFFDIWMIT